MTWDFDRSTRFSRSTARARRRGHAVRLLQLLLEELPGLAELSRQGLRGLLDRGLGLPLLRPDEEHGLVELRVSHGVLRLRDVLVLQELVDQGVDDRVVGALDLDPEGGPV